MKLESLVESGAKELGPRFNLVGTLPTAVLFLFLLALYWSGAPKQAPNLSLIVDKVDKIGTRDGILLVLGVLIFSLLLQPLQLSMVRILEGYWRVPLIPIVGRLLTKGGTAWQGYRRRRLQEQTQTTKPLTDLTAEDTARMAAADWRLRRYYPARSRLMATSLGNALRAAEDVPQVRYGLDAVVIWPRLFPLLPEKTANILSDRRNQLDVAVRFCVIFSLAAVVSMFFLYPHRWWLLIPAAALFLARLSYMGAVSTAVTYGESLQAAFDLHRLELWKALHIPLAADLESERKTNQLISDFFRQDIDTEFKLIKHESEKSKKDESGSKSGNC